MRKASFVFVALTVALAFSTPLKAQVAWDGPLLVGPETPTGWGIYLVDPSSSDGIGVLTTWRGGGPLGFRIGLADEGSDDLSIYGGVDISGRLVNAGSEFPLHVSWVGGAGFGVGDDFAVSFPLGLVVGRAFQAETVGLSPYIGPRLVLDAVFGRNGGGQGDGNDDDINLGFAVDFGLDLNFDPGWAVRFGVSGGDRDAIAIGVSFNVR